MFLFSSNLLNLKLSDEPVFEFTCGYVISAVPIDSRWLLGIPFNPLSKVTKNLFR